MVWHRRVGWAVGAAACVSSSYPPCITGMHRMSLLLSAVSAKPPQKRPTTANAGHGGFEALSSNDWLEGMVAAVGCCSRRLWFSRAQYRK